MNPAMTHAADRAKERYGIDLSWPEVLDLSSRCAAGEGLMETKKDGTQCHAVIVGDRVLWLIYQPPNAQYGNGKIITIMPPNVGEARARRDRRHKFRRLNGFAKGRHY